MTRKTSIQPNKSNRNSKRKSESGNVFLFILIGIVLFAAIGFVMSRGFRSEGTSKLTEKQAELAAGEILDYVQRLQRAYDRLRRNGCSENDISFESAAKPGFAFVTPDSCKIFHPDGGNLDVFPDAEYLNTSRAYSSYQRYRVGGTFGVDNSGDVSRSELVFYIGMANADVCKAINKKLGTLNASGNSPAKSGSHVHPAFTGTFEDPPASWEFFSNGASDLANMKSGCFTYYDRDPDTELFFYTLLER